MALTNDQIMAKNFKEFYEAILPYLNGAPTDAEDILYKNTASTLTSTNANDAIDELDTKINNINIPSYSRATTTADGLLRNLSGNSSQVLLGNGTWGTINADSVKIGTSTSSATATTLYFIHK